jgi:hypothetical protein
MKRRGFLRLLCRTSAAGAVATAAPKVPAEVLRQLEDSALLEPAPTGFGLATIKAEGAPVLYDANWSKALWPGVKEFYEDTYDGLVIDEETGEVLELPTHFPAMFKE